MRLKFEFRLNKTSKTFVNTNFIRVFLLWFDVYISNKSKTESVCDPTLKAFSLRISSDSGARFRAKRF